MQFDVVHSVFQSFVHLDVN